MQRQALQLHPDNFEHVAVKLVRCHDLLAAVDETMAGYTAQIRRLANTSMRQPIDLHYKF
jgi:hypothetical protein